MQTLIDPAGLGDLLAASRPPVVLDVRWQLGGPSLHRLYLDGHVPGAHWADLDADLADPAGPRGRHPLPRPERLERAMRAWGIDDGATVVVYDGGDTLAAARAWWVLRWAGLGDVCVLDGGLPAWVAGGGALAAGAEQPGHGTVHVRPGGMPVLDAAGAGEFAAEGVLLDARAGERFRGEQEPIDRVAGHIPGARNAPSADDVAPDGRLRPASWLRERYAALGADVAAGRAGKVAAYCGSGVTAARTVLALQVAGVPAALYAGSWSEWSADPSRPVATGD